MLTVGKSSRNDPEGPKKKRRSQHIQSETISVDDDYGTITLMFGQLGDTVRSLKEYDFANLLDIKHLADKYDLPLATRLLGEHLWVEVSDGTYDRIWAYAAAIQMRWTSLARYALSCFTDKTLAPIKWPLAIVQEIGVEAWYFVLKAADGCQPFSWERSLNVWSSPKRERLPRRSLKNTEWLNTIFVGGPSAPRSIRSIALSLTAPSFLPCKPIFHRSPNISISGV